MAGRPPLSGSGSAVGDAGDGPPLLDQPGALRGRPRSQLLDVTNVQQPQDGDDSQAKRRRQELHPDAALVLELVELGGCRGFLLVTDMTPPTVQDARLLRRCLDDKLRGNTALTGRFQKGLGHLLVDVTTLHRALLPMTVMAQDAYVCGDSFLRVVLNIAAMQPFLCKLLLEKLPLFGGGGGAADPHASIPGLILGQLRWLESVVDGGALVDHVLEVLPVVPEDVQRMMIGLLPEVADDSEQERVVEVLNGLLDLNVTLMAPTLDALAHMQLAPHLQARVVEDMSQKVESVDVEDLPALIKFLLLNCGPNTGGPVMGVMKGVAAEVVTTLRKALHFLMPSEPRQAVPDVKQKGPAGGGRDSAEVHVMREVAGALSLAPAASAAFLSEMLTASASSPLRVLDLWVLLVLHPARGKEVEALLKKKAHAGVATEAWLTRCVVGHAPALREVLPAAMALAGQLATSKDAALGRLASHLYFLLFQTFEQASHRQELLHRLQTHLGTGVRAEVNAALAALLALAAAPATRAALVTYGPYLGVLLDYLDAFDNVQLRGVFRFFALVACSGGGPKEPRSGGGRLEDEVYIVINKALGQPDPRYKRIGVLGSIALLRQLAALMHERRESGGGVGSDATAAGSSSSQPHSNLDTELVTAWRRRLEDMQRCCRPLPACYAFMLDQLTELVWEDASWADSAPQAKEEHDAGSAQGAGGGGVGGLTTFLPHALLSELRDSLQTDLELKFIEDVPDARTLPAVVPHGCSQPVTGAMWVDGEPEAAVATIYVTIWSLVTSHDAQRRGSLQWLGACLRLVATIELCTEHEVGSIDALLGCPLGMFPLSLLQPDEEGRPFVDQPAALRQAVVESLQHAICWFREVVNSFSLLLPSVASSPTTPPPSTSVPPDPTMLTKLGARLTHLHFLEQLLSRLLEASPALLAKLPDLSRPLAVLGAIGVSAGVGGPGRPPGAAAAGGAKTLTAAQLQQALKTKLRPLSWAALRALNMLHATAAVPRPLSASSSTPRPAAQGVSLCGAVLLVTELQLKLKAALTSKNKKFFGGGDAGEEQAAEVVLGRLAPPLLRGMRRHLDATAAALAGPLASAGGLNGRDVRVHGDGTMLLESALPGLSSRSVASRYMLETLMCLRALCSHAAAAHDASYASHLLTSCLAVQPTATPSAMALPPTPAASLRAPGPVASTAGMADGGAYGSAHACLAPSQSPPLLASFTVAFQYLHALCTRLSDGASPDFAVDLALLRTMRSLVECADQVTQSRPEQADKSAAASVAACLSARPVYLQALHSRLSVAAGVMLESAWVSDSGAGFDETADEAGAGAAGAGTHPDGGGPATAAPTVAFSWKGRGAVIHELLDAHVSHDKSPVDVLLRLAKEVLKQVPGKAAPKCGLDPVGGFSALCDVTYATWYRTVFLGLLDAATRLRTLAAAAVKLGGDGGGLFDEGQQEGEFVTRCSNCVDLFRTLLALVREHQHRAQVLAVVVKSGGAFVKAMQGVLPALRCCFERHEAECHTMLSGMQKGLTPLQLVCAEAKARNSKTLTAQVPMAKRNVESFMLAVKALMDGVGRPAAFTFGQLKHRDLLGQVQPSQVHPEAEDEEEEGAEEDPEYGEGAGKKKAKKRRKAADGAAPKRARKAKAAATPEEQEEEEEGGSGAEGVDEQEEEEEEEGDEGGGGAYGGVGAAPAGGGAQEEGDDAEEEGSGDEEQEEEDQ